MSQCKLSKSFKWLTAVLAVPAILLISSFADINAVLEPHDKHSKATRIITQLLKKYHYKEFSIDDALSEKILEAYLTSLDPNRSYFYQEDV
ncbi:MAG: tail-specific protease, partial [Gammaproteobacteria bacterium]|nr:tail-specific protease [Gammaproteobacteria bacterium]